MIELFGMDGHTTLLVAAGVLFALWWVARSPKLVRGNAVIMKVFCMHCNWQGRVQRGAPVCGRCKSHSLSVLSI